MMYYYKMSVTLMSSYVFNFLGERYLTGSVHGLLHLPEAVRNLGPLWAHSCFGFESANGDLLSLFHGSQGVEKQVYYGVLGGAGACEWLGSGGRCWGRAFSSEFFLLFR